MKIDMKNKRLLSLVLCTMLVIGTFGLAGCSDEDTTRDYTVTLYFTNDKYVETGDESLDKLVPVETTVNATPDEVYLTALETLRAVPQEGCDTMVREGVKINQVTFEGNTAFVDVASEGLNGGSLGEALFIGQVVETLTGSFEEIEQVQFLVDGQVVETLMGHIDASQPFNSGLK